VPDRRVFIAHSGKDKEFAKWLAETLRTHALLVWFDAWEIKVGDSIVAKINEGLACSDYLVVVLSPQSVDSRWVSEELNAAFMRQVTDKGIQILPVLLERCELPPTLAHRRYADFTGTLNHGLQDLIDVLLPDQETENQLLALATRFDLIRNRIPIDKLITDDSHVLRLFELNDTVTQAVDLRYRLEVKRASEIRKVSESVIESEDLFQKIEFLEKQLGIDLRSHAWSKLLGFRNYRFHSAPRFHEHQHRREMYEMAVIRSEEMSELRQTMSAICSAVR